MAFRRAVSLNSFVHGSFGVSWWSRVSPGFLATEGVWISKPVLFFEWVVLPSSFVESVEVVPSLIWVVVPGSGFDHDLVLRFGFFWI
jgi:hypothetical protein